MQLNNAFGFFKIWLFNRNKRPISVNTYFLFIRYLLLIVIFNSIGNFAACQAQTPSSLEQSTNKNASDLSKFNGDRAKLQSRIDVGDRPIEVKKIDVSGNTLFKTEIARLTKPFAGKSTNIAQLY